MANNINVRWNAALTKSLLDGISDQIKDDNQKFEKPVANAFYNAIKDKNAEFKYFSWKAMRDKMRYLKCKYKAAIDWRNQTGQGVLETSGELSVREYILKLCPFFDELDEVFGTRVNTNIVQSFDSEDCTLYEYLDTADEEAIISNTPDVEPDEAAGENLEEACSFIQFKKQLKTGKRATNCIDYLKCLKDESDRKNEQKFKLEQIRLEETYELEHKKLKFQEEIEERHLKNNNMKILIEERRIALEEKRIELEEKKIMVEGEVKAKEIENVLFLEKYKTDKEFELKRLELELKYNTKL